MRSIMNREAQPSATQADATTRGSPGPVAVSLQGDENRDHAAAGLQRRQRFADDGPKRSLWIRSLHGVAASIGGRQHITDRDCAAVGIDLAIDFSDQRHRFAVVNVRPPSEDHAGAEISSSRYDTGNATIVSG
jgi:hypothetical protein